jgi:hypothetical protein
MRSLSSAGVLELWERGVTLHPIDRGLLALGLADPAAAAASPDWPLGRRNQALLDLHASWFGPALHGWTSCPACGEKVEFELDARELASVAGGSPAEDTVTIGDQAFRLPTTRDLARVVAAGDAASALLERCRIGGQDAAEWTGELMDAIGERLAAADPLADTRLALDCPSCQHAWEAGFDVGRFLWAEVEALAKRVLWDVHALASAYGWSEPVTLALSPARRAMYLQLVHA